MPSKGFLAVIGNQPVQSLEKFPVGSRPFAELLKRFLMESDNSH